MKLELVTGPFTPTAALQKHLLKYLPHYGTGGNVNQPWRDTIAVWKISSSDGSECGYVWWFNPANEPNAREVSIAVFDEFKGKGVGSFALTFVESNAREVGIGALCAQVNGTDPETGLMVRKWLIKRGFSLTGSSNEDFSKYTRWTGKPIDVFLAKWAKPLFFRKDL